jgi:hypothetical protein
LRRTPEAKEENPVRDHQVHQYINALRMWSVEASDRLVLLTVGRHGDKHEWRRPYSSEISVTLMIARELLRDQETAQALNRFADAGPAARKTVSWERTPLRPPLRYHPPYLPTQVEIFQALQVVAAIGLPGLPRD